MAQLFSALFFSLALVATLAMIAVMLRRDWSRAVAILSGSELEQARASVPRVRVRVRSWSSTEWRLTPKPERAAAA